MIPDSRNKLPAKGFGLIVHTEFGSIGIGIPNWLCAVRPPFNKVAATPEEAMAMQDVPAAL